MWSVARGHVVLSCDCNCTKARGCCLTVYTMTSHSPCIVSHLMNNAVLCTWFTCGQLRNNTITRCTDRAVLIWLQLATTTSSTPDYSMEMNGARGVRATSSHHWFAAVVCKMEITSREYYSFCVISSMI